ncbi:MAG: deoxyribonuclease V [Phaeodactylibacter sp.]|nr:deoxyribonuclease V [Phaeodactylibacter sp.]MCB9293443.1 deoxyribonuclease V [Lewinellaceae bacterium]
MSSLTHGWNLSPTEAVNLQRQLREKISLSPFAGPIRHIGGADLSYNKGSDEFYAGIVVLDYESMETVAHSTVIRRSPFPYIPGLLSFREIPSLMEAWERLPFQPEVIAFDGHGIAHPRRMGIAAHFGLLADKPTIGCAKKRLTGKYEEPPRRRGAYTPILDGEETLGFALCTKDGIKPVFVSPGHRMGLEQSREVMLHCARGYKIPEPTRQAHLLVNRLRRGEVEAGVWRKAGSR